MPRPPAPPSPALVLRWAVSLGLGAAGGWAATLMGAPLPWLLGAMAATGIAAAADLRVRGAPLAFPPGLRVAFIAVIGVMIGAAMTPGLAAAIPGWWPGLVAMPLFAAAALALSYALLRRIGGLDPPTAFFASMPGGLIEAIAMGEKHGADARVLALTQFGRIALVVTLVPVAYSLAEGRAVGSSAGARLGEAGALGPADAALLFGAGVVGALAARVTRFPAAPITGPLLASAAIHGLGWTAATPPDWLVALAQLVIGTTLGLRFAGAGPGLLWRCMGYAALAVAAMLAVGAALSAALAALGVAPFAVLMLSVAPGGVVEMGLIALSLEASPLFVTAHHVARILATVTVAQAIWPAFRRR